MHSSSFATSKKETNDDFVLLGNTHDVGILAAEYRDGYVESPKAKAPKRKTQFSLLDTLVEIQTVEPSLVGGEKRYRQSSSGRESPTENADEQPTSQSQSETTPLTYDPESPKARNSKKKESRSIVPEYDPTAPSMGMKQFLETASSKTTTLNYENLAPSPRNNELSSTRSASKNIFESQKRRYRPPPSPPIPKMETSVSLCEHIRMKLTWDLNDPVNYNGSWIPGFQDYTKQSPRMAELHKECTVHRSSERGPKLAGRVVKDFVSELRKNKLRKREAEKRRKPCTEIDLPREPNERKVREEIMALFGAEERRIALAESAEEIKPAVKKTVEQLAEKKKCETTTHNKGTSQKNETEGAVVVQSSKVDKLPLPGTTPKKASVRKAKKSSEAEYTNDENKKKSEPSKKNKDTTEESTKRPEVNEASQKRGKPLAQNPKKRKLSSNHDEPTNKSDEVTELTRTNRVRKKPKLDHITPIETPISENVSSGEAGPTSEESKPEALPNLPSLESTQEFEAPAQEKHTETASPVANEQHGSSNVNPIEATESSSEKDIDEAILDLLGYDTESNGSDDAPKEEEISRLTESSTSSPLAVEFSDSASPEPESETDGEAQVQFPSTPASKKRKRNSELWVEQREGRFPKKRLDSETVRTWISSVSSSSSSSPPPSTTEENLDSPSPSPSPEPKPLDLSKSLSSIKPKKVRFSDEARVEEFDKGRPPKGSLLPGYSEKTKGVPTKRRKVKRLPPLTEMEVEFCWQEEEE